MWKRCFLLTCLNFLLRILLALQERNFNWKVMLGWYLQMLWQLITWCDDPEGVHLSPSLTTLDQWEVYGPQDFKLVTTLESWLYSTSEKIMRPTKANQQPCAQNTSTAVCRAQQKAAGEGKAASCQHGTHPAAWWWSAAHSAWPSGTAQLGSQTSWYIINGGGRGRE